MVWCLSCNAEVTAEVDDTRGFTCCTQCGVVLDETAFSTDPTFSKTPGGAATVDGNFVPDGGGAPGLGRVRGARIFGYQVRQAALRGQTKSEGGLPTTAGYACPPCRGKSTACAVPQARFCRRNNSTQSMC